MMKDKLSLIALPALLPDPEDKVRVNILLQFFVDQNGMWRDTPLLPSGKSLPLEEARKLVDQRLKDVMKEVDENKDKTTLSVMKFLQAGCEGLYSSVIPEEVQSVLQEVASTAKGDDVPTLHIHIHSSLDWIPWEIMHDGSDFLGLRFKIARLPMVSTPPDPSNCQPHPVRRIDSLLGEHVLDLPPNKSFNAWEATFDSLIPSTVKKNQFPDTKSSLYKWPTIDDVAKAEEADIIHITCHGGLIDKEGEIYWTLNHQKRSSFRHNIDRFLVKSLKKLAVTKPLIFGNACASASENGLTRGLGTIFFEQGALNFIGTFAPITKNLAIDFAHQFYQRLLGEDGAPALPIGKALWETKKYYRAQSGNDPSIGEDPSYLFYCLYGPPDARFQISQ